MRKLDLLLYFILSIILNINNLRSQSCLPNGITFTTQTQINTFPTNYPGCHVIQGNITILAISINNLDSLDQITKINGNLLIDGNANMMLQNISGLENLDTVGGYVRVQRCHALTDLHAFDNIMHIGTNIYIALNNSLVQIGGFSNIDSIDGFLQIDNNDNLTNLVGFNSLEYVGSVINIKFNDALENLTAFHGLYSIEDYLWIVGNSRLKNLIGFENIFHIGGIRITNNDSLIFIPNFVNINSIYGNFEIEDNALLADLSAFSEIDTITGVFWVQSNNLLSNLSGLQSVKYVGNNFFIRFNPILNNITALTGLDTIAGNLTIMNNPNLSDCAISGICDFVNSGGNANIQNNSAGCNSALEVLAECFPSYVLTTSNSGLGSLRMIIENIEADTIWFSDAVYNDTIKLTNSGLHFFTNKVIIANLEDSIFIQGKLINEVIVNDINTEVEIQGLHILNSNIPSSVAIRNNGNLILRDIRICQSPEAMSGILLENNGILNMEGLIILKGFP